MLRATEFPLLLAYPLVLTLCVSMQWLPAVVGLRERTIEALRHLPLGEAERQRLGTLLSEDYRNHDVGRSLADIHRDLDQ